MGHLQTIESELRRVIVEGDTEALVAWVKERILESYRNGQVLRRSSEGTRSGIPPTQPARPAAPSNLPV
ncbi:MAG TPA: hypothetical protein VKY92_23350 [Verrucomicrobiae bacterium]|nr:hypothetical protein [Verrucomicrobiae bacterium]